MIHYDMNLLTCALQEMTPNDEIVNDGQHFLVINLIVLFHRVELSAVESVMNAGRNADLQNGFEFRS